MGKDDRGRGRRDLCATPHDDDGRNPKFDIKPSQEEGRRDTNHRDLSLAKQVGRAIESELSMMSQAIDWGLRLDHVTPADGSARLRVGVVWTDASLTGDAGRRTVQLWLNARLPRLRTAVARAISRKRVPVLRVTALGPAHETVTTDPQDNHEPRNPPDAERVSGEQDNEGDLS